MRNRIALAFAVVTGLTGGSCDAAQTDVEAQHQANLLWAKSYAKCGDSYFTIYRVNTRDYLNPAEFKQYRGPVLIRVESYGLREADRANGLEWQGEATSNTPLLSRTTHSLTRQQAAYGMNQPGGLWSQWSTGFQWSVRLRKRQGQEWEAGANEFFPSFQSISQMPSMKPACSDIPK